MCIEFLDLARIGSRPRDPQSCNLVLISSLISETLRQTYYRESIINVSNGTTFNYLD